MNTIVVYMLIVFTNTYASHADTMTTIGNFKTQDECVRVQSTIKQSSNRVEFRSRCIGMEIVK